MNVRPRRGAEAGVGTVRRPARRWMVIGTVGWSAAAVLYLLSIALRVVVGGPLSMSWQFVGEVVLLYLVGALLTGPAVLALSWFRPRVRRPVFVFGTYLTVGLTYWFLWSLARGIFGLLVPPGPFETRLVASLATGAYVMLTLYTVIALLFETWWHLGEVRRSEAESARLQADLVHAERVAIRAKLDPRFLFDAFSVASKLAESDVRSARRSLAGLSEILRVSLDRDAAPLVDASEEILLAKRFLQIQVEKYDGRLSVKCEGGVREGYWRMPPLTLQPIMEGIFSDLLDGTTSSIQFGLRTTTPAGGSLKISMLVDSFTGQPLPRLDRLTEVANDAGERLRAACGTEADVRAPRMIADGEARLVEVYVPSSGA